MTLNDYIASRRRELKLTQRELAEMLNVSDKTISKWEIGRSYPDVTLIPSLATALQCSINDLFNETDNQINLKSEKEKYNYNEIVKFKIIQFVSYFFVLISYILMAFTPTVEQKYKSILIILAVIGIFMSILIFIISLILFINFYKSKFFTTLYKKVAFKYSHIYFIFFDLPLFILSFLIMRNYLFSLVFAMFYAFKLFNIKKIGYKCSLKNFYINIFISLSIAVLSLLPFLGIFKLLLFVTPIFCYSFQTIDMFKIYKENKSQKQ